MKIGLMTHALPKLAKDTFIFHHKAYLKVQYVYKRIYCYTGLLHLIYSRRHIAAITMNETWQLASYECAVI